jgi:hypothetical protein
MRLDLDQSHGQESDRRKTGSHRGKRRPGICLVHAGACKDRRGSRTDAQRSAPVPKKPHPKDYDLGFFVVAGVTSTRPSVLTAMPLRDPHGRIGGF